MSVETERSQDRSLPDSQAQMDETGTVTSEDEVVPHDEPSQPAPATLVSLPQRLQRRLLTLPLFYKVLIGNSAIVLLGALAGTAITLRVASSRPGAILDLPLAAIFAICGLALTAGLNALILRAALSPLDRLQDVVRRVRRGDLSVRAHPSALADPDVARLADTLNAMLDEVQQYEEQVRALSGGLIRAQEEERQRIARELHDDTGQVLTLLLIRLKLLEGQPGIDTIRPQIEELRGLISGAIDQVRRLALNLRPPTLDQLGLVPAVRSLVATFTESTHIPVKLELPREQVRISPERALAVYRIVQEALTNTVKHASARHVDVQMTSEGGQLTATVRDDGRGFAPETYAARTNRGGAGVGLFGMEERARLAGGSLRIQSAPGRGASVTLRVPVDSLEPIHEHHEHDEH